MNSPLGSSLANAFLSHHEKKLIKHFRQGFKLVFYRRYVDDIFTLLESNDHLKHFPKEVVQDQRGFLNSCPINMSFSMETEAESNLSFLDVKIIPEQGKLATTIYRKPTFSNVCS